MKEKTFLFGKFNTLLGIVSEPDNDTYRTRPAVILSNAGLMHRIGPNRIYVKLARSLAEHGYLVLRFDLSGVGDSSPRLDHMPVEQYTIDDTNQAIAYIASTYGIHQVVLGGHCAGAYHSFRTTAQSEQVSGVILINPDGAEEDWVEFDKKRKMIGYYQKYYSQKSLFDPQLWKRILRFQIDYRSIVKVFFRDLIWARISNAYFRIKRKFVKPQIGVQDQQLFTVESMLRKLPEMRAQALLVFSENATSLERVKINMSQELKQLETSGKLELAIVPGADHLYSPVGSQKQLFKIICAWIEKNCARLATASPE